MFFTYQINKTAIFAITLIQRRLKMNNKKAIKRRDFIKKLGTGALTAAAAMTAGPLMSFTSKDETEKKFSSYKPSISFADSMTYRINRHTGDKVSLLGFGCMRWPNKPNSRELDQEKINELVDYAIAHGVNYFDTASGYGNGADETAVGIALKKYPRKSVYIATKMSNFSPDAQTYDGAVAMYNASKKRLQVDYIDYYLLHSVGGGGMKVLKERFLDNGVLDFLLNERKEGRIRNLGFSYHGDIEVFDYLLKQDIKWDFVQIQLNYIDWNHAKELNPRNYDAQYLYTELEKRGIQAIIMEPLLGGRLGSLNSHLSSRLKAIRPNDSPAAWGFRFAGSLPNVLTVLSGINKMEHLEEDIKVYSPLDPCTSSELALLDNVAKEYCGYPMIPCTGCHYCMPCPFSLDIPAIFAYYNKCINDGTMPMDPKASNYKELVRNFLDGYNKAIKSDQQASHCQSCNSCVPHCPQRIKIPDQMKRITKMVEDFKKVVD
jgi:predicted aldo/keto reductase-like oxidoreductase